MIARRLGAALLAFAARRWPAGLRDDLHREWLAELHVLAAEGRSARIVAYALSLAVSRPAADPLIDRSLMTRRFWVTAATVLLAPLLCVVLGAVGLLGANTVAGVLRLQELTGSSLDPFVAATIGGLALLLGLGATRLGARTALRGPVRLAVAAVLPCLLTAAFVIYLLGSANKLDRVVPELLWWGAGMVGVLGVAGRLAARGRTAAAWWVGVLGALLVADVAIAITVFAHTGPYEYLSVDGGPGGYDGVNRIWAPLWLFTMYSGGMHGLPGPGDWEVTQVADVVELTPYLYPLFGAYLLAYAIRAGRGRVQPAAGSAPVSPVSPESSAASANSVGSVGSGSTSA
ncbi:hypothetical protein Cs7R123_69610 [Catellatospora sp. TT07R-123]|uniref:hypothetical protein n=1 Tax=Catellatospora sp. TT07R-123 TaxID=2733863 RepID=UPI001B263937|nr:hypothetical protein [Catellatospora sp. TT07R-123]GHJ49619.1 hypothetical protein Cs7R123_69610 [Catellatospora sp. TT07R-123]